MGNKRLLEYLDRLTDKQYVLLAEFYSRILQIANNADDIEEFKSELSHAYDAHGHPLYTREFQSISRHHNVLTLDGERGAGKTSLLHTFVNLLRFHQDDGTLFFSKERLDALSPNTEHSPLYADLEIRFAEHVQRLKTKKQRFLAFPLDTIYPDNREPGESATMEGIVAEIGNVLEKVISSSPDAYLADDFLAPLEATTTFHDTSATLSHKIKPALEYSKDQIDRAIQIQNVLFRDLGSAWVYAQSFGQDVLSRDASSFDEFVGTRMKYGKLSRQRKKIWDKLISDFLDFLGCELLVITIDDSDLEPLTAKDLSRTIQMYLDHPRIITIVGVHLQTFENALLASHHMSLSHLWKMFDRYDQQNSIYRSPPQGEEPPEPGLNELSQEGQFESWYEDNVHQVRQYMAKIFPLPDRRSLEELTTLDGIRLTLQADTPDRSLKDTLKRLKGIVFPTDATAQMERVSDNYSVKEQAEIALLFNRLFRTWLVGYKLDLHKLVPRDFAMLVENVEQLRSGRNPNLSDFILSFFSLPSTISIAGPKEIIIGTSPRSLNFDTSGNLFEKEPIRLTSKQGKGCDVPTSRGSGVIWFVLDYFLSHTLALPPEIGIGGNVLLREPGQNIRWENLRLRRTDEDLADLFSAPKNAIQFYNIKNIFRSAYGYDWLNKNWDVGDTTIIKASRRTGLVDFRPISKDKAFDLVIQSEVTDRHAVFAYIFLSISKQKRIENFRQSEPLDFDDERIQEQLSELSGLYKVSNAWRYELATASYQIYASCAAVLGDEFITLLTQEQRRHAHPALSHIDLSKYLQDYFSCPPTIEDLNRIERKEKDITYSEAQSWVEDLSKILRLKDQLITAHSLVQPFKTCIEGIAGIGNNGEKMKGQSKPKDTIGLQRCDAWGQTLTTIQELIKYARDIKDNHSIFVEMPSWNYIEKHCAHSLKPLEEKPSFKKIWERQAELAEILIDDLETSYNDLQAALLRVRQYFSSEVDHPLQPKGCEIGIPLSLLDCLSQANGTQP